MIQLPRIFHSHSHVSHKLVGAKSLSSTKTTTQLFYEAIGLVITYQY